MVGSKKKKAEGDDNLKTDLVGASRGSVRTGTLYRQQFTAFSRQMCKSSRTAAMVASTEFCTRHSGVVRLQGSSTPLP